MPPDDCEQNTRGNGIDNGRRSDSQDSLMTEGLPALPRFSVSGLILDHDWSPSENSSIYDIARSSFPGEDPTGGNDTSPPDSAHQPDVQTPRHATRQNNQGGNGSALPPDSLPDVSPKQPERYEQPSPTLNTTIEQRGRTAGNQTGSTSDSISQALEDPGSGGTSANLPNRRSSLIAPGQPRRRKQVSFDETRIDHGPSRLPNRTLVTKQPSLRRQEKQASPRHGTPRTRSPERTNNRCSIQRILCCLPWPSSQSKLSATLSRNTDRQRGAHEGPQPSGLVNTPPVQNAGSSSPHALPSSSEPGCAQYIEGAHLQTPPTTPPAGSCEPHSTEDAEQTEPQTPATSGAANLATPAESGNDERAESYELQARVATPQADSRPPLGFRSTEHVEDVGPHGETATPRTENTRQPPVTDAR